MVVTIDITINNIKHTVEATSASYSDVQDVIATKFAIPKDAQEIISTHMVPLKSDISAKNDKQFFFTKGKIFIQQNQQRTFADAQNLANIQVKHVLNQIQVEVHTLTGKIIPFAIGKNALVKDLMLLIKMTEGIPIDQQRIIFGGKQLEEEKSLDSYKVTNGAIFKLVLRLSGGMFHYTSGKDGGFVIPMVNCKVLVNNNKIVHVSVPVGSGEKELRAAVAQKLSQEELAQAMAQ